MEERHVVQVAGEQPAHRHLEEVARDASCGSPSARATTRRTARPTRPRAGRVHGASSGTCFAIRSSFHCASAIVSDRERADLRDEPGVAARAPLVDEEVRALHPRLVRGDADLAREAEDRVVLRAEPRAAAIDGRAVGEVLRPDPAADAVARLEHDDRLPALVSRRAAVSPAYPAPTTQTSHRPARTQRQTALFESRSRSSSARSQCANVAAASYVVCRNSRSVSSGESDFRTRSYGKRNSRRSRL